MAKMERKTVVLRNNESKKELGVISTQLPRATEAGVYLYGKLNHIGMAILQKKHPEVTNSKTFEELISKTFGIPANGFGTIADGKWKSAEERAKWSVLIDGEEWMPSRQLKEENPASSSKESETATSGSEAPVEHEVEEKTASEVRTGVETQQVAVADTTKTQESTIISAVKKALETYKEAQVFKTLEVQFGKDRAQELINLAKPKPQAEQPKVEVPVLDFSMAPEQIAQPIVETKIEQPTFDFS